MSTVTRNRAVKWAVHDAAIPFYDPRLARLNGTNRMGRRPHALVESERKLVTALLAANDNQEDDADAAA